MDEILNLFSFYGTEESLQGSTVFSITCYYGVGLVTWFSFLGVCSGCHEKSSSNSFKNNMLGVYVPGYPISTPFR